MGFDKRIDLSFFLVILLMFGFGLVQVYSSSFILATENYGDGLFFIRKQALFSVIAVGMMGLSLFVPWKFLKALGPFLWVVAVVGIAATLVPGIGVKVGGAKRWIGMGGYRFEPSELLKVSLPFFLAFLQDKKWGSEIWKDRLLKGLVLLLPAPLLLRQPDFGSFAIYLGVLLFLLFIFGMNWRMIFASLLVVVPTAAYLMLSVGYRRARLEAFLDPSSDISKSGFQVIQSLLSFSSGGLMGVGLGEGQGKLFFLPEAHTDFTLAVFGEEVSFVGFILLLVFFGFLILKGLRIGVRAADPAAKITALGLTLLFGLQVATNMGVVLGLLPTKGLTLPFLSYGGSSLMMLGLLFGTLMNIDSEFKRKS